MNFKQRLLPTLCFATVILSAPSASAQLAVGNVRALQRAGTKQVDIDYDVSGTISPLVVALEVSSDGGSTWQMPVTAVTGAVGSGVAPGTNLRITWNPAVDWDQQYSTQARFRIKAEEISPILSGFVVIPSGVFTMGDTLDGMADASPHPVNLSRFLIKINEVTNGEWAEVRQWGLLNGYSDLKEKTSIQADPTSVPNLPALGIDWFDAVKWCNAKSEKEGLTPCYYTNTAKSAVYRAGNSTLTNAMVNWDANGYRLPTEAEWEKSARGGVEGKRYPLGNTLEWPAANFGTSSPRNVGLHQPNGYGLYDMAGNVWEWCWDVYGPYSPVLESDPHGPSGTVRELRGGSYSNGVEDCRVAYRYPESPGMQVGGLRLVREAFVAASSASIVVDTRGWVLSISSLHGTASGAGLYAANTNVEVVAAPNPGYLFAGWAGAASGTANPLSVLMDSDKAITATFSPDTTDADNDGLTNYQEIVEHGSDPADPDTDDDEVEDGDDAFPLNPAETLDTDEDGIGDNADLDDDADGLSDADEVSLHGTNPKRADSDGDGLNDKAELQVHFTNPLDPDWDDDGLTDGAEFLVHHTGLKDPDSDDDGFLDGYEVLTGKRPLDPLDKPALVAEANTAIEFTFPSALGKTYRVEGSSDLSNWTLVESGIVGNGGEIQRFYSIKNQPKRYFRVEEEGP